METKLRIWIVLTSWKRSFYSKKEVSASETNLWFWKQSSEFKLEKQFENKTSISEKKLRFQNQSCVSGIEASFPESTFCFQKIIKIQIRSFVSNLLLQIKFEALFPEPKRLFRKHVVDFGIKIWFRKRASNLSCNNKLETKLRIWIVVTVSLHKK